MNEKLRNTISLFLLIIGLATFSHAIIPHDHHYDNTCDTKHQEHQENETSDAQPIHCHFFNDIIVDTTLSPANYIKLKKQRSSDAVIITAVSQVKTTYKNKQDIRTQNNQPDYLTFRKNSPTRGSPTC